MRHIESYTITQIKQKIVQYDDNFDNESILHFVIHSQSRPARWKVQLCHNQFANLFEKEKTHISKIFPK